MRIRPGRLPVGRRDAPPAFANRLDRGRGAGPCKATRGLGRAAGLRDDVAARTDDGEHGPGADGEHRFRAGGDGPLGQGQTSVDPGRPRAEAGWPGRDSRRVRPDRSMRRPFGFAYRSWSLSPRSVVSACSAAPGTAPSWGRPCAKVRTMSRPVTAPVPARSAGKPVRAPMHGRGGPCTVWRSAVSFRDHDPIGHVFPVTVRARPSDAGACETARGSSPRRSPVPGCGPWGPGSDSPACAC